MSNSHTTLKLNKSADGKERKSDIVGRNAADDWLLVTHLGQT